LLLAGYGHNLSWKICKW